MAVERVLGEKMYIDWVGDTPELLTDPETGEIKEVHLFATTLGVSSLIYAEAFMDEKLPQFISGTVHAVEFYGGITKYFVPDNLRTAVTKHTKDELVSQSSFSDLEDFYDTNSGIPINSVSPHFIIDIRIFTCSSTNPIRMLCMDLSFFYVPKSRFCSFRYSYGGVHEGS